jgi:hypothetical protein
MPILLGDKESARREWLASLITDSPLPPEDTPFHLSIPSEKHRNTGLPLSLVSSSGALSFAGWRRGGREASE